MRTFEPAERPHRTVAGRRQREGGICFCRGGDGHRPCGNERPGHVQLSREAWGHPCYVHPSSFVPISWVSCGRRYGKGPRLETDVRAGHLLPPRGRQLHRARLGARGRRAGHRARHAHLPEPEDHARKGRAIAPGRERDHTAQQADRLRFGAGRERLPAGDHADHHGIALRRRSLAHHASAPRT